MMNSNHLPRASGKLTRRGGWLALFAAVVLIGNPALAQQQQAASSSEEPTEAARTIARMMDPTTWAQMMTMSMDPRIWMNPISSCAACHNNEDVARYQQVFGPFTAAMMNPAMWSSPDAYNEMMASVLDQKAAEHWTRAVEEKYGLQPGDTLPTMHNWWPMVTPVPAMPPAQ